MSKASEWTSAFKTRPMFKAMDLPGRQPLSAMVTDDGHIRLDGWCGTMIVIDAAHALKLAAWITDAFSDEPAPRSAP